jgi:hypothetical protein
VPWFVRPRRLILAVVFATAAFAIWSTAVPNLLCGPRNADECAAIATLKNLRSAQQQFLAQKAIDRDGDGRGEAGFFDELNGSQPLRAPDGTGGRRLQPAVLSQAFAVVEAGRVHRSGYWFQLFLPTSDGRWVGSREQAGDVGTDASETAFCIYAWPDGEGNRRRACFTDANGDTLACANRDWRYCGLDRPVPVDAALPSSAVVECGPGVRIGRDGQAWLVVD